MPIPPVRSSSKRILIVAATLLAALAVAMSAHASIFLALSLEDLTARADRVVVGRVLSSDAVRTDGGMIRTRHRVQVDQELRGSADREVFVETLGGEMGNIGMYVSGEPSFTKGDEVVLFLQSRGGAIFHAVGATQGVMRIERRSGRAMVVPSRQESLLVRRGADARLRKSAAPLAEAQGLDEFLETVRAILEAQTDGAQ